MVWRVERTLGKEPGGASLDLILQLINCVSSDKSLL